MDITIYRDPPRAREFRTLPAATYNLIRKLQGRASGALFVPVRSMQFLAVADAEEIVFVDHLHKELAVLSWTHFNPQARESLEDPVRFEALYYREDALALMRQLQGEFHRALLQLENRLTLSGPARVIKFERNRTG